MDIREFAEKVAEIVENKIGNVNTEINDVIKNNGVMYTGIVVREFGNNVAPTIYINEYFDNEVTIEETAAYVVKMYEEYKIPDEMLENMEWFNDFDKVKGKLKAKLVKSDNKQYVGISAKKYGFDDLKIVPYVNIDELGVINITPKHLEKWDVNAQKLVSIALKNIKDDIIVKTMKEYLAEMMGFIEVDDFADSPLNNVYIVSNKSSMYGAISVITAKKELNKKFNGKYVVLPSSIHEVIVLEDNEDLGYLTKMVQSVNGECVSIEDQLSDRAYRIGA